MNYDIEPSQLEPPGKDSSLEKVSFSVGQMVTSGCQFSVGHKDIPVRITRAGYIAKITLDRAEILYPLGRQREPRMAYRWGKRATSPVTNLALPVFYRQAFH
jgi:hypothetical protein